MTDRGKSRSSPSEYGGFDKGIVASVDGEDVTVSIPRISNGFDIPLTAYVGSIPEVGSEAYVAMLHDSFGEFAAIFPGGGGGGKVETDFLVASSDARSEVKAVADFVCDGVNDEEEIVAAIDAVIDGSYGLEKGSGRIVLSSGAYNVGAPIEMLRSIESLIIVGAGKEATQIWCDYGIPDGAVAAVHFTKVNTLAISELTLSYYGRTGAQEPFCLMVNGSGTIILENAVMNIYNYSNPDINLYGVKSRYVYANNCEITANKNAIHSYYGTYVDGCVLFGESGPIIGNANQLYGSHTVRMRNTRLYGEGDGVETKEGKTNVITGCYFEVEGTAIYLGDGGIGQGDFVDGNLFFRRSNGDPEVLNRPHISINDAYNIFITGNVFTEAYPYSTSYGVPGPWVGNPAGYANDLHIVGNSFAGGSGLDLNGYAGVTGKKYALLVEGNALYGRRQTVGLSATGYEYAKILNNVFAPMLDEAGTATFDPIILDGFGEFVVSNNVVISNQADA